LQFRHLVSSRMGKDGHLNLSLEYDINGEHMVCLVSLPSTVNNNTLLFSMLHREKQLKLEKMRAIQTYIEEFKKEQAVWRQRKREEMEEENRRIVEFANNQREREEDWMAKVRDMEEKKQRLQAMVLKIKIVDKHIVYFSLSLRNPSFL